MAFSTRRIPGTLVLAATNLIAAWSWVDDTAFRTSPLFAVARDFAPLPVWVTLWVVSAIGLVVAVVRRSLVVLHVSAALSMAVWSAAVAGIFWATVVHGLSVSPVALALLFWMAAGQFSMFLAPLWRPTICPPGDREPT